MSMQINVTPQEAGTIIFKIDGEIGMVESEELDRAITKVIVQRPKLVVVDLSGVTMIASIGMGRMLNLERSISRFGGAVRLAGVQQPVLDSFKRARLTDVLVTCESVETALRSCTTT